MKSRSEKNSKRIVVPKPDRVRQIGRSSFGWIDARFHREGWFQVLAPEATTIYAFLCLVANRQGVSWYRRDRIGNALGIGEDQLRSALRRLYDLDLVAYRPFSRHASDGFHQVMSLPPGGPPSIDMLLERCFFEGEVAMEPRPTTEPNNDKLKSPPTLRKSIPNFCRLRT